MLCIICIFVNYLLPIRVYFLEYAMQNDQHDQKTNSELMTITETPHTTYEVQLPLEVVDAYDILPDRTQRLGGGLVNFTYLVETSEQKLVLQRVAHSTPPESTSDFDTYTQHLGAAGWNVPRLQPTLAGAPHFYDESNQLWRSMSHIECDEISPETLSTATLEQMGVLLARWHKTMAWLDHAPAYQIPYFHDTDHHLGQLRDKVNFLPNEECTLLAEQTLYAYHTLPPLPASPYQLVHGDPKMGNMLFRNGKPFTFIDLDTVLAAPIWVDMGDMLRSTIKLSKEKQQITVAENIAAVAAGYFDVAVPGVRLRTFTEKAVVATQRISLELIARYLNDIVDAHYFTWDDKTFVDRAQHHYAKAIPLWHNYQELSV